MAHYLTLLKNGRVLHKAELNKSTCKIGRDPSCTFRIFDDEYVVSRQHAVIEYFDGQYWIKNDQGRCGTLVNGESAEEWRALEQADAIIIGSYVITYSYGYKWHPDGPTLYTGPEDKEEEKRMASEETAMIENHQRPEFVRIEFSDGRIQFVCLDQFTIGRQRGNTVWVQDQSVSDVHAEIFAEDGCWYVRDLDSEHGIRVSNHTVRGRCSIRSGQTVQLGKSRLRFKLQRK